MAFTSYYSLDTGHSTHRRERRSGIGAVRPVYHKVCRERDGRTTVPGHYPITLFRPHLRDECSISSCNTYTITEVTRNSRLLSTVCEVLNISKQVLRVCFRGKRGLVARSQGWFPLCFRPANTCRHHNRTSADAITPPPLTNPICTSTI